MKFTVYCNNSIKRKIFNKLPLKDIDSRSIWIGTNALDSAALINRNRSTKFEAPKPILLQFAC